MRSWAFFWSAIIAILGIFAAVNWSALAEPTTINLVFAEIAAPMGLTMLGAIVGLTLLFLFFVVWLETKALVNRGRVERSSHDAASIPIAELRAAMDREFSGIRMETGASIRAVMARLDKLEHVVKEEIERGNKTLSSSLRQAS
jgi:uncharacterized integral membrane protein